MIPTPLSRSGVPGAYRIFKTSPLYSPWSCPENVCRLRNASAVLAQLDTMDIGYNTLLSKVSPPRYRPARKTDSSPQQKWREGLAE